MRHYTIPMDKPEHDPLQRPARNKGMAPLPLASDVLLASAARRLIAFVIDMMIITALVWYGVFPLAMRLLPAERHNPLQLFTLLFFLSWGLYVALCNASPLRATPGQGLMRVYVATVFGGTISFIAAIGRFIVFSAPALCMMMFGAGEILHLLPVGFSSDATLDMSYSSFSELFYIIPVLVQFLMIWPMLNGNYNRVLWDRLFHSCVLRSTPRTIS